MANDLVKTGQGGEVVERAHSQEMEMTEFVQWFQTTFGTLGVKEALQQAAFLLCCDVIAQDMAKATLRLRERTSPKTSRILMPNEHPVAAYLAMEPNRRHTWYEFKEMMGLWGCITQNAFAVVRRNRFGEAEESIPVQTGRVLEKINDRAVFYDVTASTMQELALLGAALVTVPERDMIHVRGRMLDGMDGYSTMTVGKQVFETGKAIEDYRKELFGEDGQIRGVFVRPGELGVLPDEAFQRFKQQMRALMQRVAQKGEPIVLEGGIKFERISVDPSEAELTKQLEAQIKMTCRLLRVPPHKVFHLDAVKYENLESIDKQYLGDTLDPICQRYERRYERAFLTEADRRRLFIEHDREEMAVKDTKAETERAVKALERGGITFDEFRARLGYNEYPNGQGRHRLIPSNMNVVDENGNVVIGAKAGGEPKASEEPSSGEEEASTKEVGEERPSLRIVANNEG